MRKLFAILLCRILEKMNVSAVINIHSDGRLKPRGNYDRVDIMKNKKIAIALSTESDKINYFNYVRYCVEKNKEH